MPAEQASVTHTRAPTAGIGVLNLSLSSRSEALAGHFHDLADAAYFHRTLLVCAANNVPGPSYPSLSSLPPAGIGRSRRPILEGTSPSRP